MSIASAGSIDVRTPVSTTATAAAVGVPRRILMEVPTLGERLETLERTLSSIRAQSGVAAITRPINQNRQG